MSHLRCDSYPDSFSFFWAVCPVSQSIRAVHQIFQEIVNLRSLSIAAAFYQLICQSIDAFCHHGTVKRNLRTAFFQYDIASEGIFRLILIHGQTYQHGSKSVSPVHGFIYFVLRRSGSI